MVAQQTPSTLWTNLRVLNNIRFRMALEDQKMCLCANLKEPVSEVLGYSSLLQLKNCTFFNTRLTKLTY